MRFISFAWSVALTATAAAQSSGIRTYANPIDIDYKYNFEQLNEGISYRSGADPVVVNHGGEYYLFATIANGYWHSRDLVTWRFVVPSRWPFEDVVAPAALSVRDTLYLLQSATQSRPILFSTSPATGRLEFYNRMLPPLPFAVAQGSERPGQLVHPDSIQPGPWDPALFRDDDGRWYLFYCRDFLEGERVGTGIVVDELRDLQTLAGRRHTVVRPFADWNLFAANREWYGRTWEGWYTVEGPFVRKRDGRYYCFFSGGAWREPNYGVSYAVAEHPLGPWKVAPGEGPTILRTVPDAVLGPGHASIVTSPSGAEDWIVYHAWPPEGGARLMRIDRLEWTPAGPRCDGPSVEPRPAPS